MDKYIYTATYITMNGHRTELDSETFTANNDADALRKAYDLELGGRSYLSITRI